MQDNFLIVLVALFTFFVGKAYIWTWDKINRQVSTPSGFGVLLPIYILISFGLDKPDSTLGIISVISIFLFSLIYWIDDFAVLSPELRVAIAFTSGALLFLFAVPKLALSSFEVVGFAIMAGVFSTILTNVTNFYDGEDLNLVTTIFLSGVVLLFFQDKSATDFSSIGVVLIGFSIGFGLINRVPFSLYLGDSGAFSLALVWTFFLINSAFGLNSIAPELMLVAAFPMFDVFYVLLIRIYHRHNLLSRNYLHLYQRIKIQFGGFFHLLPQTLNVCVLLLCATWIEKSGASRLLALLLSTILITPVFYLVCRYFVVGRGYFFGDGKASKR